MGEEEETAKRGEGRKVRAREEEGGKGRWKRKVREKEGKSREEGREGTKRREEKDGEGRGRSCLNSFTWLKARRPQTFISSSSCSLYGDAGPQLLL